MLTIVSSLLKLISNLQILLNIVNKSLEFLTNGGYFEINLRHSCLKMFIALTIPFYKVIIRTN